jgi:hypothetical protein
MGCVFIPMVDCGVSHFSPGVEETQSLGEVRHPGAQGPARPVSVFLWEGRLSVLEGLSVSLLAHFCKLW